MVEWATTQSQRFLGRIITTACEASIELKKGGVAKVEIVSGLCLTAVVSYAKDASRLFIGGDGEFTTEPHRK